MAARAGPRPCGDRSSRGARGNGSSRRPRAPRRAGRRSGCRSRRRRRSPRRSGPAGRTRRLPGRAAAPRPERRSRKYPLRDLDPRAWFLHPWALIGRVAGTGRGDKAPLFLSPGVSLRAERSIYWRSVRRPLAPPGSRRRLVPSAGCRGAGVGAGRSSRSLSTPPADNSASACNQSSVSCPGTDPR